MSDISNLQSARNGYGPAAWFGANKGVTIAAVVFFVLFAIVYGLSASPLAYFDYQYISSGGMTTAVAAVGATIVILSGGFDLSAGAVVSLVNVVVASILGDSLGSQALGAAAGIAIGAAVGVVNGYFIAFLRLQSIVVTLATMFVVGGLALLVRSDPGGYVPGDFSMLFVGSLIEGYVPAAFAVLALVIIAWLMIKRSRFGTAIYAIGTDEEAAGYSGVNVRWTEFWAYVVAGVFYAVAGIIVTAQTTTGDPLVGKSLLLEMFTAVVLGGTLLGGGRGGCVGTILGAYSLMLIINILLVLNIPAFYSTIVQAVILIAAAIGLNIGGLGQSVRWLRSSVTFGSAIRRIKMADLSPAKTDHDRPTWFKLHRSTFNYVLPSFIAFAAVVAVHAVVNGGIGGHYVSALLLLSTFLAILALGQGSVILIGGLDLSVGWSITFCGIILGQLTLGDNSTVIWAVPFVLAVGVAIGLVNGFTIVFFQLPAIVVTLAMNGLLQGIALLLTGGTPTGFAPDSIKWFMTGSVLGVAPAVLFTIAFAVAGYLLLSRTNLGRRIYAVGNNPRVAHLSGVNTGTTTMWVYALSGLCSAIVGIMLTGFSGRAILGMGDAYLLTSIAVVVIGGTLITGGRGNYIGMIGGVLLLVALQILLTSILVPPAVRDIIFGVVILFAIVALRDPSGRSR